MTTLARGGEIMEGSITVLRREPRLLALPIISGVAVTILLGGFARMAIFAPGLSRLDAQIGNPWFYVQLFFLYLACAFIVVFCNAALIYCAQRGFNGERATLGEGLAAAAARSPQILGWSLFVSTFRVLLTVLTPHNARTVKDGSDLVMWLIGALLVVPIKAVLSLFAYFVLPVIVVEGLGWTAAVKRSAALISGRWGEVGEEVAGVGWIALLCLLPPGAIAGLIVYAAGSVSNAVLVPAAVVTALAIVAIAIAFTAFSAILSAAAYAHAVSGTVPSPFGAELMDELFEKEPPPAPADKPA
jgi:hypothetical protein